MAEPPANATATAAVAAAAPAPQAADKAAKKDDGTAKPKSATEKPAGSGGDAAAKSGDKKPGASSKAAAAKKGNPLRAKYPSLKVDERIKLAAAFINDAQNGRFEHGEASGMLKGSWNHWAFSVYYNPVFQNVVLVCIIIHLCIIFFEPANSRTDDRANSQRIGFLLLELLLTCVHLFDTWLKILHMGKKEFLSKGWNSYTLYYRVAIGADALFCLITGVRFRFSRILRPALMVTRNRELRQLYDTVSQTVFELVEIATLILSLIVLYAVIALQLFGTGCPEEWSNYWSSALSLFVLLTGDNYPDIFQKPYELSPTYVLFFVSFLFLGVQMLLPLVLAIVVESYKEQQKDMVSKDRIKERKGLIEAFVLLDHKNEKAVDLPTFEALMKVREGPNVSREKAHFFFKALDTTGNGRLDMLEWLDLCDILLLKFQELPPETAPKKVVDPELKKRMEALTSKLTLAHGAGNLVLWIVCQPLLPSWLFSLIDTVLLLALAADLAIRAFVTVDIKTFLWAKEEWAWNRLDIIVVLAALIARFSALLPSVLPPDSLLGVAAITLGSLRVVRLVYTDQRIRERIAVILRVAPFMWYFSVAILMTYYAFAVMGMELLGGRLSDAYENFNDIWSSLLTLFSMMMLADWSNTMYDAMEATNPAIVIFFVSFYLIVVVIVLNLFLAVILDAYSVQEQSTEEVEMEIDSATPGQPKKRVLVTKRQVQWKRELLRGELPELKKQELAQLSKGNDVDLVALYGKKEEQAAKNPSSASLHATLFGAHFVAKVKLEAQRSEAEKQKGAEALRNSQDKVSMKEEKKDGEKKDGAKKEGDKEGEKKDEIKEAASAAAAVFGGNPSPKPAGLAKGMGAALARARSNIAARKEGEAKPETTKSPSGEITTEKKEEAKSEGKMDEAAKPEEKKAEQREEKKDELKAEEQKQEELKPADAPAASVPKESEAKKEEPKDSSKPPGDGDSTFTST